MQTVSRSRAAPIVVTGAGVVSPIGREIGEFDAALFASRSAVRARAIELPGLAFAPVPVACCEAFDADSVTSPSRLPLDRGTALALAAARDAIGAAGFDAACTGIDRERLGVYWGSGMGGSATFELTCKTVYGDRRRMRPTSVVTTMPNAPAAEIALAFGARGAALAYCCACASSAVAIGEAMRAICAGLVDIAIAGGSESMLTPGMLASWQAMRVVPSIGAAIAPASDDIAARCCRPFAADRSGFALGEGAAAFVLESSAHARARAAPAHAHLVGYATNCDGVHMTQPDAGGQARAMRAALHDAGLEPGAIGYVNAHGTATKAGDAAEAASIAEVFGSHAVPISSTKAIHGHLLGAGGAVELLVSLRALARLEIPATANVDAADPASLVDLVCGRPRTAPNLEFAMSNSFAFGGTNAVLIVGQGNGESF